MLLRPQCDDVDPIFQKNHAPTDLDERRAQTYAETRLEREACEQLGYEWRESAAGGALGYHCRPDLTSCPPAGKCVVPDDHMDKDWCAEHRDTPVYGCRKRKIQCEFSRGGREAYSPGQVGDDPKTGTCYACPSYLYAECKDGYKQGDDEPCGVMGMGCRAVCVPADQEVGECDLCYWEATSYAGPKPDALHAQIIYPEGQDRRVCAKPGGGLPDDMDARPLCLTDAQCAAHPGTSCQDIGRVVDHDFAEEDSGDARHLTDRTLWGAFARVPNAANYGLVDTGVVVTTPDGTVGQACGTLSGPCFAGDSRFLDMRALDNAARGVTVAERKMGTQFGPREKQGQSGALCWGDGSYLDPTTYTLPADTSSEVECNVKWGRCKNLMAQGPERCTSDEDCRCMSGQLRLAGTDECVPVVGGTEPLVRPTASTVPRARVEGNTNLITCNVAGSGGYPGYGACQAQGEPYGVGHADPCLNDTECADGGCHLGVCRAPGGAAGGSLKTCHLASNGLTDDQLRSVLKDNAVVTVTSADGSTTARVGRADVCDAGILTDATTCKVGAMREVCTPLKSLVHVDKDGAAHKAVDLAWDKLDDGSANWGVHGSSCVQEDRARSTFRTDYMWNTGEEKCEARLTATRRWCEMPWTRVDPGAGGAKVPPAGETTLDRMHENKSSTMHPPFYYDRGTGACSITRSYCENGVNDGGYATEYGAVLGDNYECGGIPEDMEVATGGDCCSPPSMKGVEFLFGKTMGAYLKTQVDTGAECLACLASDDGTAPGGEPCNIVCGEVGKAGVTAGGAAYFLSDRRLKRRVQILVSHYYGPNKHQYKWKWNKKATRTYPHLKKQKHEWQFGPIAQEHPHSTRRDKHGYLWILRSLNQDVSQEV